MNLRILLATFAILLPLGNARAQTQGYAPLSPNATIVQDEGGVASVGNGACRRPLVGGGGTCASCDSPVGGNAAIGTELIWRNGASFVFGNQRLGRELGTGFTTEIIARTLFYSQDYREAFIVDLGVGDTYNPARSGARTPTVLNILQPNSRTGAATRMNIPVTVKNYNRSYLSYGVGKQWFLWNDALTVGDNFRVGVDIGGRWGSSSARFNEIRHRTDTIDGLYIGGDAKWETPTRFGMFSVGVRTEWTYTWTEILQAPSDMQEINLLLSLGVRY
ncbi:MAG: hypothetical protein K2X38_17030 [Gemmataceae bacterium]|nr:hypothetical protein [Gemmataceae bacterium]